jgi:hypothetical protein
MELGKLNRELIVTSLWRGTLLRLLMLVVWPWCAVMAVMSSQGVRYVAVGLVVSLAIKVLRG